MKFIELTRENFDKYAKQIVNLCDQAVESNEKNNKSGQFYTSTVPELYGYVISGKDLVLMAVLSFCFGIFLVIGIMKRPKTTPYHTK